LIKSTIEDSSSRTHESVWTYDHSRRGFKLCAVVGVTPRDYLKSSLHGDIPDVSSPHGSKLSLLSAGQRSHGKGELGDADSRPACNGPPVAISQSVRFVLCSGKVLFVRRETLCSPFPALISIYLVFLELVKKRPARLSETPTKGVLTPSAERQAPKAPDRRASNMRRRDPQVRSQQ
jgi:hypothetical protein